MNKTNIIDKKRKNSQQIVLFTSVCCRLLHYFNLEYE